MFKLNDIFKKRMQILNDLGYFSFYYNTLQNVFNDLKKIDNKMYTKSNFITSLKKYISNELNV